MLLPSKNRLLNVLVSLVEFERVILLGSTFAGQEFIYPVGGRWVGGRWVGGRWVGACSRCVGGRCVGGFTITPLETTSHRRTCADQSN